MNDLNYPVCNCVVFEDNRGFLQENGEFKFDLANADIMPEDVAQRKAISFRSNARCIEFDKAY